MQEEEFLKLTYKELEQKTSIRKGTWSKYFSCNAPETPNWKTLEKISIALNMPEQVVMKAIKRKRSIKKQSVAKKKLSSIAVA